MSLQKKSHSKLFEWQKNSKTSSCGICGETRDVTVDHIIPVNLIQQFTLPGNVNDLRYEWEENFQYLCRYHNVIKGGHIDPRNPKTYKLLTQLLNKAYDYHILKL